MGRIKSACLHAAKRGFSRDLTFTVLDFYIVRYRLCVLLYRNGLWLEKQKENKQVKSEDEFENAEVEDKISKHTLLSEVHVHP
jgi:hypothetical protein